MIASPRYLELCRELHTAGWRPQFEAGMRVGRGYADLGYEEFLLLPNGKLVSLVNGSSSELPQTHIAHFFSIPDAAALVQEIRRRGFNVTSIEFAEQREFRIRAERSGSVHAASARVFEEALAKVLLGVLTAEGVKC